MHSLLRLLFGDTNAHIKGAEWSEIPVSNVMSDLVNQAAYRILVGLELCRDGPFLKASLSFMESIFIHAMITISLPFGPLRGLFGRLISLSHRRNLKRVMKMLQSIVEQKMREIQSGESKKNHNDGIDWTLRLTDEKDMDAYTISLEVLHNLFAGNLAPGAMLTELIFQAMMDQKLLQDVRNEALRLVEKIWFDGETMVKSSTPR